MKSARENICRRHPRRVFLAGGLALAWGASRAFAAPGEKGHAAGQARKLGVALVGLGDYATNQLAPALAKTRHCALRGIVTGSPHKVARWQESYDIRDGSVYDYASLPRLANDPAIDIVYVVLPTGLHAKYAIMAAEAGKHVWCEKPMALTVAECQAIIAACRANKVSLSIGYRMQHEPNTRTVMQWARTQPYGAIRSVRALAGDRSDGAPGWRMQRALGGGALYDMGVYSINAIRYASGAEPLRVLRARQWAERPTLFREVDECTEFELELPDGTRGHGKASRADNENTLRVEAKRGWYALRPMQTYRGVAGKTSDGKALDEKIDNQQARQMDDDALAILERRAPMVPGEEGLRDIRVVEAIKECAQTRAPVAI